MAMFPPPLVCPAVDLNSRRHSKPRGCLQSKPPVHANLPAGTDIRNKVSLSDVNQEPPPSRVLGSLLIAHGASLQPLRRSLRRGRPRIARLLTRGIERRILAFGPDRAVSRQKRSDHATQSRKHQSAVSEITPLELADPGPAIFELGYSGFAPSLGPVAHLRIFDDVGDDVARRTVGERQLGQVRKRTDVAAGIQRPSQHTLELASLHPEVTRWSGLVAPRTNLPSKGSVKMGRFSR
jgi:hypothetical protein